MVAALEKTVTIGADRRITLDISELEGVPEGEAQIVLFVLNGARKPANTAPAKDFDAGKTVTLAELTKNPSTEEMLADAEKIWAYNRAHPQQVRATLRRLHGSCSSSAFGGLDGISYQRKVRAEWDND